MMREAFEYYCEWAIERFIFGMNYKLPGVFMATQGCGFCLFHPPYNTCTYLTHSATPIRMT